MGNMSYCRFENTARDLRDCVNAIHNGETDELNEYEKSGLNVNSIKKNYGIDNVESEILSELVSRWSPYNSIACLFLWESIENRIFYSPKA